MMVVALKISKALQDTVVAVCLGALLVCRGVRGASTNQGNHFVFQLPFLQEPDGYVAVSLVTSWTRPFTVSVTAPNIVKPIDKIVWLYHMEPLTFNLKNMYSLGCIGNRQVVTAVVLKSAPTTMFAAFICVMDTKWSIETFPLIPVEAFSTDYYITTFEYNPFIIVLPIFPRTILTIQPRGYDKQDCYLTTTVVATFDVILDGVFLYESCYRTTYGNTPPKRKGVCAVADVPDHHYIGVLLKSIKPYGVIAGNSRTYVDILTCNTKTLNDEKMTAAFDSVMHNSWFGTSYIIPHVPFKSGKIGNRVMRIVCVRDTFRLQIWVNVTIRDNSSIDFLIQTHERVLEDYQDGNLKLITSEPVQVHYGIQHDCESPGSMAYSIIVPCDQGYYSYIWTTPETENFHPDNSILLVVRRSDRLLLLLDNGNLTLSGGSNVYGDPSMVVLNISVSPGPHSLYSMSQLPFLCYLYGNDGNNLYLHPAGFLVSGVTRRCTYSNGTTPLDLVDDDCDGKLDEEVKNGIDDDRDGLTDEDIRRTLRVHGGWSDWGEWFCQPYCGNPPAEGTQERRKSCNNETPTVDGAYCPGPDYETGSTPCEPMGNCEIAVGQWGPWSNWFCPDLCRSLVYSTHEQRTRMCNTGVNHSSCAGLSSQDRWAPCFRNFTCPEDCPDMTYGIDCVGNCSNCLEPCDKHTGHCRQCDTGYSGRRTGCNLVCPPLTYGNFCVGSCPKKCRTDCTERINGTCPPPIPSYTMSIILIAWPLSVIPLIYMCYIIIKVHTQFIVNLEEE